MLKRPRFPVIALLAAVAGLGALPADLRAEQVEVFLIGGDSVVGERLAETEDTVTVRRTSHGITGSITYQKRQIVRVVSVDDQYQEWVAKTPDTAEGQVGLARWCLGKNLNPQARKHAERSLALDANYPDARMVMGQLGLVRIDGKWISRDEYLEQRGLVSYSGKVMTKAQRVSLEAIIQSRRTASEAERTASGKLAQLDKDLAAAKDKLDAYGKDKPAMQNKARELDGAQKKADAAKKRAETADARVANLGGNKGGYNNANQQRALQAAREAQTAAHQDYDTAQAELKKAESSFSSAKSKLADLERDSPALQTRVADLTKARPAVAAEADAAKAKLAEVEPKYQAAFNAIESPADLPAEFRLAVK